MRACEYARAQAYVICLCSWARTFTIQHVYVYITFQRKTHCILSVISSFSNLNRWCRSLGLFCRVSLKRDRQDWDSRLRLEIEIDWHCKCNRPYSLLHLQCHSILISNLNLLGLFSTKRGKRDLEIEIIDWELRMKKWHCKCNRLYHHINV